EQGEVEPGKAVTAGGAAKRADDVAGPAHRRRLWVGRAGQLDGEVGLDRDAEVGWAVGIVTPGAVGLLLGENIAGRGEALLLALTAEESHEENELGLEDGVALQFADPVAIALLEAIESGRRPLDAGVQRRRTRDGAGRGAGCSVPRGRARDTFHGIPFLRIERAPPRPR